MKKINLTIIITLMIFFTMSVSAQEKKIKFNKGILKICSTKNFQITGYDGDEVIIKSLSSKRDRLIFTKKLNSFTSIDSVKGSKRFYSIGDESRKNGLKKLGKNYSNNDLNIYFTIEQKDGMLIFQDDTSLKDKLVIIGSESYEIKIPNSLKLFWKTNLCSKENTNRTNNFAFYHTNPSSLSNFNGEVEIESTLNNIKLFDIPGPVAINSVGGNITVEFNKKRPLNLYSIYSNNGFIDMQIPESSEITADVEGKSIYSNLDFKVLEEKEKEEFGLTKTQMKLKLGTGKVKIKLNSEYGNIYLRQK